MQFKCTPGEQKILSRMSSRGRPAIRSCEYLISSIRQIPHSLANSANTFGEVSKHTFEGHTHTFCCVRCLFRIVLAYRSVDMQPSTVFFVFSFDLEFTNWAHAWECLLHSPKKGHFRGANTCEYPKTGIWYSHYLVFAKYCEHQIAGLFVEHKKSFRLVPLSPL